ncbi:hypothetical protein DFO67_101302 [Modicisalibacter xianhensis]|uniref:Uncharacterized protein n=1 Tax=Modicisalibacter xianhensis TaxID=442341 RepID=A0A4V3GV20_9GAMM|nr:tetratricopeptide repeat protein [Halomonas xianhensis]TDX33006.1 hypothetical protein DFO67_101302 [Halomonas xianhensis]
MLSRRLLPACLLGLTMSLAVPHALAQDSELFAIKNRWENITATMREDAQAKAMKSLAGELEALAARYPESAEVFTWLGIVQASAARAEGGMGALSLVKQARASLERAIELDPRGSNASAYVTLGALYDKVPGWPIGFGDSDKAESMFRQALSVRPEGIDVNYYYAVFLADEGREAEALTHARRAIDGTPRQGREASDKELREEAKALAAKLG